MATVTRVVLWFASVLLSLILFSSFFGPGFFFVFRIAMIFALPVAVFYVPFVLLLPDAEDGRMLAILGSGILIGPVCLFIWGLILVSSHVPSVWQGDGIAPGLGAGLILAMIVGSVTTVSYVIALKVIYPRFTRSGRA